MITYVNTVLVANGAAQVLTADPKPSTKMATPSEDKGKFIIVNCDPDMQGNMYTIDENTQSIKIGIVTGKNTALRKRNGEVVYQPIVKWSNIIKKHDIKSFHKTVYFDDSEDKVEIDLTNAEVYGEGRKRYVVKLTFKDMPHRYRKWTESYDYVSLGGQSWNDIAQGLANAINGDWKRARVSATVDGSKLILEALPYDDDDMVDSLSWANKVRFSANMYYTNPDAFGFDYKNKYALKGATITKTPGKWYTASAKLVRDREDQANGYLGVLNHDFGICPTPKPDPQVQLDGHYNSLTLEFENMYRAADDIFRKTKQCVEIYVNGSTAALESALEDFAGEPFNEGITTATATGSGENGSGFQPGPGL